MFVFYFTAAVRTCFPITDKEFEKAVMVWLQYAKVRYERTGNKT